MTPEDFAVTLQIKVPLPGGELAVKLMGVLGLIAAVIAVGGLTANWWWSALAGGLVAFGLAVVAETQSTAVPAVPPAAAPAGVPRAA